MQTNRMKEARTRKAIRTIISCNVRLFWRLIGVWMRHLFAGTRGTPDYTGEFTKCQTRYGSELFHRVCNDLGMTVNVDCDGVDLSQVRHGLIVVSNHTSIFDIPLLYALMELLNWWRSYWVLKSILRWLPWGIAAAETHGAFVDRDRSEEDRQKICLSALAAARDNGAFVIFPEGTRATVERLARSPHAKVIEVRPRGFALARGMMPDAYVLLAALGWSEGPEFRTIMDLPAFQGRTLTIHAKLFKPSEIGNDPGAWLKDRAWPMIDQLLVDDAKKEKRVQT